MAENPIPKELQSEHLFLLIGGNPLPNYVAAKLLWRCAEGKTADQSENKNAQPRLYLVHSPEKEAGTEKYAGYLRSALIEQLKVRADFIELVPVEESNPRSIREQIEKYFPKDDNKGNIGLHYTGGTKAMAVHAYLKIKELCKDRDALFSYLNPRKLELIFDHLPDGPFKLGDPTDESDEQYFHAAKIDLLSLLQLHGLKPRGPKFEEKDYFENPRKHPRLPELAGCIFDIYQDDKQLELWNTFKSNLSGSPIRMPEIPALKDELKKLGSANDTDEFEPLKYDTVGFPSLEEFLKWLRGKWLEDFVLQLVLDISKGCSLHHCGGSLEPALPNNDREPFFEIDVVALRGYQLFAFSCTASERKSECKEKLFEVYVRAQQLGGDEARVGLVCRYENALQMQEEVQQEWSIEKGKIKVFGKKDWSKLQSKLEKWFDGKE